MASDDEETTGEIEPIDLELCEANMRAEVLGEDVITIDDEEEELEEISEDEEYALSVDSDIPDGANLKWHQLELKAKNHELEVR